MSEAIKNSYSQKKKKKNFHLFLNLPLISIVEGESIQNTRSFERGRDGNFFLHLTCPSPLRPSQVFPVPQRWWGGNGARFQPHPTGRGEDGFRLFRPTLPQPASSRPRPVLLRVIIIKFSYSKTLLFKQTYQYQLILFSPMWFFTFILSCVTMRFLFLFFMIVLLNTWIYYSIISKN